MPFLETLGNASARAFGFTRGSAGSSSAIELINTQILGSATASVTFSSIPQTYKHLQIRIFSKDSSTNGYTVMTWNSNNTNFFGESLYAGGNAQSFYFGGAMTVSPSNNVEYSGTLIDILDYTATNKFKFSRSLGGSTYNSMWLSGATTIADYAAITTLTFTGASTYTAGSRFSLYGVKG
jgi:hypothetical protein